MAITKAEAKALVAIAVAVIAASGKVTVKEKAKDMGIAKVEEIAKVKERAKVKAKVQATGCMIQSMVGRAWYRYAEPQSHHSNRSTYDSYVAVEDEDSSDMIDHYDFTAEDDEWEPSDQYRCSYVDHYDY